MSRFPQKHFWMQIYPDTILIYIFFMLSFSFPLVFLLHSISLDAALWFVLSAVVLFFAALLQHFLVTWFFLGLLAHNNLELIIQCHPFHSWATWPSICLRTIFNSWADTWTTIFRVYSIGVHFLGGWMSTKVSFTCLKLFYRINCVTFLQ